jgi:hypothetical protein
MDRLHVNPIHTVSLGSILTSPSYLYLGLPNSFFLLGFLTTILCELLIFPCHTLVTNQRVTINDTQLTDPIEYVMVAQCNAWLLRLWWRFTSWLWPQFINTATERTKETLGELIPMILLMPEKRFIKDFHIISGSLGAFVTKICLFASSCRAVALSLHNNCNTAPHISFKYDTWKIH